MSMMSSITAKSTAEHIKSIINDTINQKGVCEEAIEHIIKQIDDIIEGAKSGWY